MTLSERVLQYRNTVLGHARLNEALDTVLDAIAPGLEPEIVLVFGPTGVGKSTLLDALARRLLEDMQRTVCMEIKPPGSRGFEFSSMFWQRFARTAFEAFAEERLCPDAEAARLRLGGGPRQSRPSADELRDGVLSNLRSLQARAVLLDEAQHMTQIRGGRKQADQLDVIKGCVNDTQIPHVLAGTYDLRVMVAPNDQLGRRSTVVHFPPYDVNDPADREAFADIFVKLVKALPLPEPRRSWDALDPHLEDVYLGSVGCVGVLKKWLVKSLHKALKSGVEVVDWKMMQEFDPLKEKWVRESARRISEYRKSMASTAKYRDEVRYTACAPCSTTSRPSPTTASRPGSRAPSRSI